MEVQEKPLNSNTVRCPACNGTKKVSSLGHMFADCTACGSIGYVTKSFNPLRSPVTPSNIHNAVVLRPPKRYGKKARLAEFRRMQGQSVGS